jgi:predicted TIM-barrel fold metal-dependent hydrolase
MTQPLYAGPIIDAHHHLWDLSLGRHPWITGGSDALKALGDVSFLRRDYLVPEFLADIGPQNVVGSVYIEAAWDRTRDPMEEVAWLAALPRPPGIAARSIAWADLRAADAADVLARLAARPGVVGIRETIRWHPDPAKRWAEAGLIGQADWRRGFAALQPLGLLLEWLMNPYQAEEVARLAQEHPGQRFVINHCGTPVDRDAEGLARWHDGLRLMAAQPNIAIKISNFGAYDPDRSVAGLRRTVMGCIDAFGTQRSMFGTDYPVAARSMTYQALCDGFAAIVADFPAAEQRALFHDNAARIYRFVD